MYHRSRSPRDWRKENSAGIDGARITGKGRTAANVGRTSIDPCLGGTLCNARRSLSSAQSQALPAVTSISLTTRRDFLRIGGLTLALSPWSRAVESSSGAFEFIVVNDTHYIDEMCKPWHSL